jgi:hypothetical protein
MRPDLERSILLITSVAALCFLAGCAKQLSDAERLSRGREIVQRMSDKLASANTLSLTSHEHREIVARDGQKRTVQRTREVIMKRPNRLYSNYTGDQPATTWYDGKYVTVAMHAEKVYGQLRSPDTLDATLDTLSERYGIVFPIGDLLYTRPEKLLLPDDAKGGYVDTQRIDGTDCDHVSFTTPGVDWELWVTTGGDPLPKRIKVTNKKQKGAPVFDITFANWNLAASASDDLFKPKVPQDYEGIAILQRAAAVSKDEPGQPADTRSRPAPQASR